MKPTFDSWNSIASGGSDYTRYFVYGQNLLSPLIRILQIIMV